MCAFLCIGCSISAYEIADLSESLVEVKDVTTWPIGQAVLGQSPRGNAYLLTIGGCSCSFFRNSDSAKSQIRTLLRLNGRLLEASPFVSALIHEARGNLAEEKIIVVRKQLVSPDDFLNRFPTFEKDVRYITSLTWKTPPSEKSSGPPIP